MISASTIAPRQIDELHFHAESVPARTDSATLLEHAFARGLMGDSIADRAEYSPDSSNEKLLWTPVQSNQDEAAVKSALEGRAHHPEVSGKTAAIDRRDTYFATDSASVAECTRDSAPLMPRSGGLECSNSLALVLLPIYAALAEEPKRKDNQRRLQQQSRARD